MRLSRLDSQQHMQHQYQHQQHLCAQPRVSSFFIFTMKSKYMQSVQHWHHNIFMTRYPSSYTPANTGSCVFTISKASSDVCQLRLDFEVAALSSRWVLSIIVSFQTFTGFATTTPIGSCSDSFAVAGLWKSIHLFLNSFAIFLQDIIFLLIQARQAPTRRQFVEPTLAIIVRSFSIASVILLIFEADRIRENS